MYSHHLADNESWVLGKSAAAIPPACARFNKITAKSRGMAAAVSPQNVWSKWLTGQIQTSWGRLYNHDSISWPLPIFLPMGNGEEKESTAIRATVLFQTAPTVYPHEHIENHCKGSTNRCRRPTEGIIPVSKQNCWLLGQKQRFFLLWAF